MTMLITKFNKLIASKVVWLTFIVLIVLAFVVWDLSIPEDARDAANQQSEGTLNGEPVSPDEFRTAYANTYLGLVLMLGQDLPRSPEMNEELTQLAWKRLVTLRKADEMGVRVTDSEVTSHIRRLPFFREEEGGYNPSIFQGFVEQFLPQLGFNLAQFKEHIRQELALMKMQRMVMQGILVAPSEVTRAMSTVGDRFTVEYATITKEVLGEGWEMGEEDIRAFFDENPERFTLPEERRVMFVRFPLAPHREGVEITEEQARTHYDVNLDDYTVYEEPEENEVVTEEGDEDLFTMADTIPFEEVQDDIMAELQQREAMRAAFEEAMDFSMRLLPDRNRQAPAFDDLAAERGVEVEITETFTQSETPEGVDAGSAFTETAFMLNEGMDDYFSDPVRGEDYVYVMALDEIIPPRVPAYEEVKERVAEIAHVVAERNALEELAETFIEIAREALKENRTFASAAEEMVIPVERTEEFTAAEGLEDVEFSEDLVRAVLGYNAGEIADRIDLPGMHVVPFVVERKPFDPVRFAGARRQIVDSLSTERGRILFDQWQEHLLREANFERRQPAEERAQAE